MCGIAGIISKNWERSISVEKIKLMIDVMSHRGPDDEGIFLNGPVALGHRRLSIIDLSEAAHQPMTSMDNRYIIVFNGEIYNYLELRKELLEKGHSFKSSSDTEVIIEAYRAWNRQCVEHFNGMWAFALYDTETSDIFISRDRFGIKPMYYLINEDFIVFASEIKAILAVFPDERIVNWPMLHHFLPSGISDDGTETFFKNIYSLLPAFCGLYCLRTGSWKLWKYWEIDLGKLRSKWDKDNPIEDMWELLRSSVEMHMRSHVAMGTCLSGGIDSSTIVGIMSFLRSDPVHTFSGLYTDRNCNEIAFVDSVNKRNCAIGHSVYPNPCGRLTKDFEKITYYQDEPITSPGLLTQYYVMKEASKHVKVILDGQGGDEVFGGYLPYFGWCWLDWWKQGGITKKSSAVLNFIKSLLHWNPFMVLGGIRHVIRNDYPIVGRLVDKFKALSESDFQREYYHPSLTRRVKDDQIRRHFPKKFNSCLEDQMYQDLTWGSIPRLLHYEDRNSMAFSIEARVPLLDHRIVEFAFSLGSDWKIRGTWTKWLLRKAASRVLPHNVTWRRSKLGYPTPGARWLRQDPDRQNVSDIIFSKTFIKREIVNKELVRLFWDQHQSGKFDRSRIIFRYLAIELWFRQFIDSRVSVTTKTA